MAQPQEQNFQQTDNYYHPTTDYLNTTTGTEYANPTADTADSEAGAAGYPPAEAASSTGYVPGEYDGEFPVTTAEPDGTQTQETGEAEAGAENPEQDADPGENPEEVNGAGPENGPNESPEEPPAEALEEIVPVEVSPPSIEAEEAKETRRNSKNSQNYSTKYYGGRSSSRRRKKGSSDDYSKSYSNSQSYPTTASVNPCCAQQQGACQIGVIPMRSAAFQAPRIPLPKLCKNLLPCGCDEGDEDEDGVAFQFKPQTNCRTEVTFTIEPKPQPPWLTMLNCGFKPMVNCSAPPCYLSPSGNPGMDYMGGTQTVVNRTFGSQVQYCGMANFPTLQQIQNSFPGGKIIDASRKDKKGKAGRGSGSSSYESSSEDSSSGSGSEDEHYPHQHYPYGHPYHQYPNHQYGHHAQHYHAQVQKHQHSKPEDHSQRRKTHTQRKSRMPSSESFDSRRKSTFTEREAHRRSTVHGHDHKHRHSRHSHHHQQASFGSGQPISSDSRSRSSDWHL